MGAELLLQAVGMKATHVPYKSGGPALQAIMAGEVDFGFGNVSALAGHAKSGLVRPLAITAAARNPNYADVPTVAESGVKGYEVYEWNGIFAPAGTPREIVQRLNAELNKLVASDEIKARLDAMGTVPGGGTPEDFNRFIDAETAKWAKVIKAAGVTADG